MAAADDLKDNSLQIDNSRLEKEEELNFGVQSEQIKELFNEATQKKLQEIQHYQDEQLITERDQLFSAIQGSVKNRLKNSYFNTILKIYPNSRQIWKMKRLVTGVIFCLGCSMQASL